MEDRYLFKAKTAQIVGTYNNGVEDGIWVYGSLRCDTGKYTIFQLECERSGYVEYEVDPDTICQCTGLKDKHGNLIWENDVVFVTDDAGCSGQIDTGVGEIDFLGGLWYISGSVQNTLYDIDKCFQIEVIGNIFDNPELLESER